MGSGLLEIRYKYGYEEISATVRGHLHRLAAIRSTHPDAASLRHDLGMLATTRRGSVAGNRSGLRAKYDVRVSTYEDFGETAYRVTFRRMS